MSDESLLCIGLTTMDVVAMPVTLDSFDGFRLVQSISIAPAGTAAGAALVAAKLGVPTQLCGVVGDDAVGRFVRNELEYAGVDTSFLTMEEGIGTAATLLPIDANGVRPVFHALGATHKLMLSDGVRKAAQNVAALHYAGVGAPNLDGGTGRDLLGTAKAAGVLTTCDLIGPGPNARAELQALLPYIDVFLPSSAEARVLTGETDLERAAAIFLSWGAGKCVIKNGADGVFVKTGSHAGWVLPAMPIATVVDTTSCGDSFCAGFIAATLRGKEWEEALVFASATAALVAQGPATLGALQSFEQVEASIRPRHEAH
jgi:sugar/nucleoside kinase (ribokinase family)